MSYLISVIMPVYNGSKFILRIIDDLNRQILSNFEVIFIDDGSTDDSYELISDTIKLNKCKFNCILIRQANKGVSAARNNGIRNASGQYLCFVDVDDGIKPEYLNQMYEFIRRYQTDVVFCNIAKGSHNILHDKCSVIDRDDALECYLYGSIKSGVCTLMVSKGFLTENNLWFAEGYNYSEDLHMCWRILACSTKVGLLKEKLYLYYNNQDSAMNKFGFDRYDSLFLIKSLEDYFEVRCPRFYPLFKTYAVARVKWSLMWQAASFLSWFEYKQFRKGHDFKTGIAKLVDYPEPLVAFSSRLYLVSEVTFFYAVKFFYMTRMRNRKYM